MLKIFLTAMFLSSSVLLATPSWAQSDEGSAFLDWSSLTITGAALTPLTQSQFQGVEVNTYTDCCNAVTNSYSAPSWSDHTVTASLIGFGTSTSIASAAQLLSVVMVQAAPGFSGAEIQRTASFLVMNAGDVTVNVRYGLTMTHGVQEVVGLTLAADGTFTNVQDISRQRDQGAGTGLQTGTLSLTRAFNAGDHVYLSGTTSARAQSVPIPDMLWAAAIGMVGVAWLVAWRQRAR